MFKVASSKALGFGVLAVAAWLLSMLMAGFMSGAGGPGGGAPLPLLGVFAGVGLLVAGIVAFLRSEAWLGFFFVFWAAVAWSFGGVLLSGWLWLAIALVNFYLWLAAGRAGLESAVGFIAFLLGVDALGQGLNGVVGLFWAGQIGAYFGLAAAAVSFYVSAAFAMCPEGCDRMPKMGRKHPPRSESTTV
ncbi:MAG: hypothetical protein ACRES9_07800 [Gammaproteobacteria bacterium]